MKLNMNTVIILNSAEVSSEEDLRSLFAVDAQFVNIDNQYFENYGNQDDAPFDAVLKEYDWKEDLDTTVLFLKSVNNPKPLPI